jgi:triphosphoribosyl-dephospho-CoA synthase
MHGLVLQRDAGRVDPGCIVARLALRSLHAELVLYPKPGLVSPRDNGSHRDMTAVTFARSLFALRHYFRDIARAGAAGAPFHVLRQLGIDAERTMLLATGGVNTHRGAIFSSGMLAAAIGAAMQSSRPLSAVLIRQTLRMRWGAALALHTNAATSHGHTVRLLHAASGAREEAERAFPAVFELALPRLDATLAAGRSWREACVDTLFALIAHISDTNIVHRGGVIGGIKARELAQAFLQAGGTAAADWEAHADACGRQFVALNLSPGGAADLLAATCLVHHATRQQ